MRTRYSLFVLIAAIAPAGCSYMPAQFDVTQRARTTIQKGTVVESLVGSLGFGEFANLDLSDSQEFKSNDVQKRHIANAKLKELELRIVSPEGQNFDFLENISFFIEAPGLEKKRIAHKKVPRGTREFACAIDELELAPYVRADSMTVTTAVRGRRPQMDTEVEAKLVLSVGTVLWRGD